MLVYLTSFTVCEDIKKKKKKKLLKKKEEKAL